MLRAREQHECQWLRRGVLLLTLLVAFLFGPLPAWSAVPCLGLPQAMPTASPAALFPCVSPPLSCPCCPHQGALCVSTVSMAGVLPSAAARLPIGLAISMIYPRSVIAFLPGRTISPLAPPPRGIG